VLTGASATIVVRIFGPELEVLRDRAQAVGAVLQDVPGVSELKVEPQTLVPQVQLRLRPEVAANFGLTPARVRGAVTTLVKGQKVGEVFEEQKIHDVMVWSVPATRSDLSALRELQIETPGGGHVLLGIAARNGIMLVSHYLHLEREEHETFGDRLILRGAEERLTPILMTAACAGLALLPLVIRGNLPGQEIEYPMAVVILGGLVTSTVLNLLILPALYAKFSRK